jgi:hypothetical protein
MSAGFKLLYNIEMFLCRMIGVNASKTKIKTKNSVFVNASVRHHRCHLCK